MASLNSFRRSIVTTTRSGLVRTQGARVAAPRRTLFSGPNTIKQQQAELQGGTTPYLRGEADPTYLRKGPDSAIAMGFLGVTAVLWAAMGVYHYKMWMK